MAKKCAKCNVPKDSFEFRRMSKKTDGLDIYCKECRKELDKKFYNKDLEKSRREGAKWKKLNRESVIRLVVDYLELHPCVDCGEKDILVLDFDHRENKTRNVSDLVRDCSIKKIVEEINKCDVRCANCHRRKTLRENNSLKYKIYCQVTEQVDVSPLSQGRG